MSQEVAAKTQYRDFAQELVSSILNKRRLEREKLSEPAESKVTVIRVKTDKNKKTVSLLDSPAPFAIKNTSLGRLLSRSSKTKRRFAFSKRK